MPLRDATPGKTLAAWGVSLRIIARYFLYRAGLGKPERITDHWDHAQLFYRQITGMDRRIRVRGMEHCPRAHPAIFAANHVKLDDPFYCCYAVQEATDLALSTRFVMRDDFFDGPFWRRMPFDINEIAQLGGAHLVSLDHAQYSQLKPLVNVLCAPFSFAIFPGRSRTRSGLVMDYRPGYEEPGAVSFFVAQAQRRMPGRTVPAVPMARTHNPVTGVSAVAFGPPVILPQGADRAAQRAFDEELADRIGDLIEIHAVHLVSIALYLRLLHGRQAPWDLDDLAARLGALRDRAAPGHLLDPALGGPGGPLPPAVLLPALRHLERAGMIRRAGSSVAPDAAAILRMPPLDTRFRKANPVRFHVNQVLHRGALVAAAEGVILPG